MVGRSLGVRVLGSSQGTKQELVAWASIGGGMGRATHSDLASNPGDTGTLKTSPVLGLISRLVRAL